MLSNNTPTSEDVKTLNRLSNTIQPIVLFQTDTCDEIGFGTYGGAYWQ